MDLDQHGEKDSPVKSELFLNRATSGVAAAGLTYPAWENALHEVSGLAAALVPILSVVWLAVQIVRVIIGKGRDK